VTGFREAGNISGKREIFQGRCDRFPASGKYFRENVKGFREAGAIFRYTLS